MTLSLAVANCSLYATLKASECLSASACWSCGVRMLERKPGSKKKGKNNYIHISATPQKDGSFGAKIVPLAFNKTVCILIICYQVCSSCSEAEEWQDLLKLRRQPLHPAACTTRPGGSCQRPVGGSPSKLLSSGFVGISVLGVFFLCLGARC